MPVGGTETEGEDMVGAGGPLAGAGEGDGWTAVKLLSGPPGLSEAERPGSVGNLGTSGGAGEELFSGGWTAVKLL